MPPKTTLWQLEPHTLGKHLVLKRYLDAWLPIMAAWNGRILFIDGFAGPGKYQSGEDGSPVIALKALKHHAAKARITAEVSFVFIEADRTRADHLDQTVASMKPGLPGNCATEVIHGAFDEEMTDALDKLDAQAAQLAPAFVMVDPFGVAGTPMAVLRRVLRNPRSELYVSLMQESINRFGGTPEFAPHLDELFGTQEWRRCLQGTDPDLRRQCLYALFERQLRDAGATYVLHFDLYAGNRLVYSIFFASQNAKGCDKMKEAIWKVAPQGEYMFRPSPWGQLSLDFGGPGTSLLRGHLTAEFASAGWVTIEDVEQFVSGDRTPFHTGHLKRKTLVPMEEEGLVEVDEGTRELKRTYPPGTRLRFRSKPRAALRKTLGPKRRGRGTHRRRRDP